MLKINLISSKVPNELKKLTDQYEKEVEVEMNPPLHLTKKLEEGHLVVDPDPLPSNFVNIYKDPHFPVGIATNKDLGGCTFCECYLPCRVFYDPDTNEIQKLEFNPAEMEDSLAKERVKVEGEKNKKWDEYRKRVGW